jgi:hypothetical protein
VFGFVHDRRDQRGEVRRVAVAFGAGGDDAQRAVAIEESLGGEAVLAGALVGGGGDAGAGVGVGEPEGGEQHRAFAFFVDLPGRGVLGGGGVAPVTAQRVFDVVGCLLPGVDPGGPLLQPAAALGGGEVGGEQEAFEVLAGLGVPRAGLGVAGHPGGLDHPFRDPVGGFLVDRCGDR